MGPSLKDIRTQGEGVYPVQTFCGQGVGELVTSDADVRTFWCKNVAIFEIYVCPHGQGGLSQCGHFVDKEEEVNFSRFCEDALYGPLYHDISPHSSAELPRLVIIHY